ncbi:sugar phosphate isomerase/epimerase family protein [Pseudobacter ginsenosidimutans]|uniref:sugar phosphate isomerase/epimerase family protein n=1 Tax=Pseudobacter ginsenosidimutans TaxID=661488 RepID=UPI00102DA659|nr:TIM barrel protein [Pseudobacter ginsenosidimutans]QEC41046.1 TIM barrel protein [Pseudobacter ginsenosidimutans]
MNNIFISTVAFAGIDIEKVIETALQYGLNLEFSSGLPYNPGMGEIFINAPVKRLPHNYFPAPDTPFVLNLASSDENIRLRSLDMCRNGLMLARQAGSAFYAAHAGFCIDPQPTQLGKQLDINQVFDRNMHWGIFAESVRSILQTADELEVDFLIENNVLAEFNLTIRKENPLFCCDADEMIRLMNEVNHPRLGILLDTAHLKVSGNTLGFNFVNDFGKAGPYIKAIHHSDNEGKIDNNQPLTLEYWCGPLLKEYSHITQVIEVKSLTIEEVLQQQNLLENFLTDVHEY